MFKLFFFIACVLFSFNLFAQDKVEWTVVYNTENQSVTFKAEIEEGWHLYSQKINEGIGPVPTTFTFEPNKKKYKLVGKTIEPTPKTEYDPNFEGELSYFEGTVEFVQQLKIKSSGEITGKITFMLCNEEMCIPPVDVAFNFKS